MYALVLLMYVPKVYTYNIYSNANEADVYNVRGVRTNASLSVKSKSEQIYSDNDRERGAQVVLSQGDMTTE